MFTVSGQTGVLKYVLATLSFRLKENSAITQFDINTVFFSLAFILVTSKNEVVSSF